jgi:hypothetical protein
VKKLVALIFIAFVVTLAVVVGNRMSTDAMAVVIGIVCGVGASIPTSLLILSVASRREAKEERGQASFPPVVIVNPGNQGGQVPNYHQPPALPPALSQGGPRQFRVIGQEDAVIDGQWSENETCHPQQW